MRVKLFFVKETTRAVYVLKFKLVVTLTYENIKTTKSIDPRKPMTSHYDS